MYRFWLFSNIIINLALNLPKSVRIWKVEGNKTISDHIVLDGNTHKAYRKFSS